MLYHENGSKTIIDQNNVVNVTREKLQDDNIHLDAYRSLSLSGYLWKGNQSDFAKRQPQTKKIGESQFVNRD